VGPKFRTLLLSSVAIGLFFTGCKKDDPCKDLSCLNDGTCINGKCACADGYEGESCAVEERSKLIGTYVGTIMFNSQQLPIGLVISESPERVTHVAIGDSTSTWSARVVGPGLIFERQVFDDGATINGSGQLVGNTLSLYLSISGVYSILSLTKQ